ncbi:thioredoxin-disulfide reductase [Myroides marinus]|uniref:thioredoxin-disulfide reductase n=1 Tax=Myroides marinus TaxID=703342 RepID=UPI0025787871|nr:thioredoxin-disulfide reductase [Myroides marinus]MDM1352465.1 thioredoxin-disulfide reductase [Myroides marinus]MDM1359674.1 thioredoxin-disulfide reductase [Myroides marinus]
MNTHECIIIGSGPAGYTAAIYAARYGRKPLLFSGLLQGGQLTQTTDVDNYPGFPNGIQGEDLVQNMLAQALLFGTEVKHQMIVSVDTTDRPFKLTASDDAVYYAESVIIATGATAKYLGVTNEQKYLGMGVSACATCDGYFYRNKEVIVVGGGDTALEEAIFLANLASKVHLLVRKDHFRASAIIQDHLKGYSNVEIHYNTELEEVLGNDQFVEAAVVRDNVNNTISIMPIDGIFIAIGHTPNTEVFQSILEVDDIGYIKTIPGSTYTNVPGIFACGDVQDTKYRQAITAAGSGCMAAIDTERFLNNRAIKNGFYCVEVDSNGITVNQ